MEANHAEPAKAPHRGSVGGEADYQVVARRYRPQLFEELLGQEHIAQALRGAIASNRVGHAYLFCGARGVGKTSAARILAKALNCQHGPTTTPCNRCDSCLQIAAGADIDVLEIDGASNRGIDEIRTLRQNVGMRPARSRYKVYIIDEVHMLTPQAFNALLKTLEEPPEHVKFIFCTTEPEAIPVTILSRCQRFDFAGIQARSIAARLAQIVEAEGATAEPEALAFLAQRAAGSMRDGQSLLEQVLACGEERITLAGVQRLLGVAPQGRICRLAAALAGRDVPAALAELDSAIGEGADVGQLMEQLVGYLRDVMVAAAGCTPQQYQFVQPADAAAVADAAQRLGLDGTLAALQIVDRTLDRMRFSTQPRVLAELCLVRICRLANLEELADLAARLRGTAAGGMVPAATAASGAPASRRQPGDDRPSVAPASRAPKKNEAEMTSVGEVGAPPAAQPAAPLEEGTPAVPVRVAATQLTVREGEVPVPVAGAWEAGTPAAPGLGESSQAAVAPPAWEQSASSTGADAEQAAEASLPEAQTLWQQAVARLPGFVQTAAGFCQHAVWAGDAVLEVAFLQRYTSSKQFCERPEQLARIRQALADVAGRSVAVRLVVCPEQQRREAEAARPATQQERLMEAARHPLVRQARELFGARPIRVEAP
jgi:DNA polymerase-3 subunit gamma/tau